jgi:DNA replication protein DnaC
LQPHHRVRRARLHKPRRGHPPLGAPGTDKLATALAAEAVRAGKRIYFIPLADLVAILAKAEREGTLRAKIRFLYRCSLRVVDEIGYLPATPGGGNLFFQLVNAGDK